MLQPFGSGNPEPVFSSPPLLVKSIQTRTGFCRLDVQEQPGGPVLSAKAWRQAATMPASIKGSRIRLAYTPRIDRYNGAAQVELRVKDWKPA